MIPCTRKGFVSVWIGKFPTVSAAEKYFGLPDEIGVFLAPEKFAQDLGLDDLPSECLEVNFEQVQPRPLRDLLQDASFSDSYLGQVLASANGLGLQSAQGVALMFDFDYQAHAGWKRTSGPLQFIGTFPYRGELGDHESTPDPEMPVREKIDDLL